jgi:hypothetical protein
MNKSIHKSNVRKIIFKISKERGKKAEELVFLALSKMKNDNEIISFYKTNYFDDKIRRIDFYIFDLEGNKIPIQIKSSYRNAISHKNKFPDIPVVVVHFYDDISSVIGKIKNILENI